MATSMLRRGSKCQKYTKLLTEASRRNNQHLSPAAQKEDDAHYPKIKPKFPPGKWGDMDRRVAWMWAENAEKISQLRTYKEKVDFLNDFNYKAWKYNSIETTPMLFSYKCGVTKSKIVENAKLCDIYDSVDVEKEFSLLRPVVIEVLEQAEDMNRQYGLNKELHRMTKTPGHQVIVTDNVLSRLLLKTLLQNVLGSLVGRHEHIFNSRFDEDSTVAAFWIRDGVERFPIKKKVSPNYMRQDLATFYGEQNVDFHIRKPKPLPEFASSVDPVCCDNTYDRSMLEYSPQVLGQFADHIQKKIDPGYIIGDQHRFTHLNIIFPNCKEIELLGRYGEESRLDGEMGYLLSTNFLTTLAQAHALGFNKHEELTYPFTTQTILTDGQNYTLSAYQLNTLELWKDDKGSQCQNVLWKAPKAKLFESYENGKVVGFNDELFTMLLKMLLIEPSDRDGKDLSPNIDSYPEEIDIPKRKEFTVIKKQVTYDHM